MDLRFCKQMDGWCCQASDSRDDCCAQGVGFQWLNATQVNYNVVPVESASFVYELTYTATSDPVAISALTKSLSLANAPTATALGTGLIIATTSATTGVTGGSTGATSAAGSAEGKCPNDNAVLALGAGLGVGLGVPLLAALAGLCWLASKQRRYKRVSTTTSDPSTAGVTATSGMGMTMSGPNSPFSPQYPYGGGDYQRQQHGQAYQRESYFDRSNVGAQGGGHAGYMGMGHQQGAGEMKTELPGHSAAAELPGRQWQS